MAEFEEILENFKPPKPIDSFDLILEKLKMSKAEFFQKYRDCMTFTHSLGKTIEVKVILTKKDNTKAKEPLEFELSPEQLGLSKKGEVLICTRESDIITFPKRKLQSGYFVFKVSVLVNDIGEWKNKWLLWENGKLWLTDLDFRDMFTVEFAIDKLRDETLSDYAEAFEKRVYITPEQYEILKKQKLIEYTITPHGNIEV
jgi:hypothetical protein